LVNGTNCKNIEQYGYQLHQIHYTRIIALPSPPHLQIVRINPILLLKAPAKQIRSLDRRNSLRRKVRPRLDISTRSVVLVLLVNHIISALRVIPPRPSLRLHNVAEVAVLEDDSGVWSPWATQHSRVGAVSAGDVDLVEDVDASVVLGVAAVGGDVAGANGLDVDLVEPGDSSLTKDEVDGSVDEGFGVDLTTVVGENGVLVAGELAAVEPLICLLCADCKRLSVLTELASRVGDVQVVESDIW
jgi:hypothetical protein